MAGPIFPLYGGRISMAQVSYDLNFWNYWYFFCIKSKIHHCRGKDMKQNRNRKHFSRNMIFLRIFLLKGTVAWDFCPLVFFSNWPHLGPCLLHYIFSSCVSTLLSYSNSKFVLRYGPLRGTRFFLADTRDLKLGWCRPSIILFIYIHFFGITVPLKDMANF
jgi:hypothetical protein